MKRKLLSLLCAACLLLGLTAQAQSGTTFNVRLFADAKKALPLLEAEDYEGASAVLVAFSADELRNFVRDNIFTFGEGVQTTVSVAYWTGSTWNLAVPLYEPIDGQVETLVLLIARDLSGFTGYGCETWDEVSTQYAECDYVIWNEEYVPNNPYIIED